MDILGIIAALLFIFSFYIQLSLFWKRVLFL